MGLVSGGQPPQWEGEGGSLHTSPPPTPPSRTARPGRTGQVSELTPLAPGFGASRLVSFASLAAAECGLRKHGLFGVREPAPGTVGTPSSPRDTPISTTKAPGLGQPAGLSLASGSAFLLRGQAKAGAATWARTARAGEGLTSVRGK